MGVICKENQKYQKCIDACRCCSQACEECFMECLKSPDVANRVNHLKMLMECTKACEVATCFMIKNSQFAKDYCNLCATICEKCAQECETFEDEHCKKCADECNKCSTECKNMSTMQ